MNDLSFVNTPTSVLERTLRTLEALASVEPVGAHLTADASIKELRQWINKSTSPVADIVMNAVFETPSTDEAMEPIGRQAVPVKRLEIEDDESMTVVLDYWPSLTIESACATCGLNVPLKEPKSLPEELPSGQVYGIIDPDFGRYYSIIRKTAWDEGYAIGLHGSFTKDLDLIAVPWTDRKEWDPQHLVNRICGYTGLVEQHGNPYPKPHGRKVWTLLVPGMDPRYIDLSILTHPTSEDKANV